MHQATEYLSPKSSNPMLSHLTGFAHFGFESGLSSKSGLLLFKQVQDNSGITEEQQRLIVNYKRVTDWPWVRTEVFNYAWTRACRARWATKYHSCSSTSFQSGTIFGERLCRILNLFICLNKQPQVFASKLFLDKFLLANLWVDYSPSRWSSTLPIPNDRFQLLIK